MHACIGFGVKAHRTTHKHTHTRLSRAQVLQIVSSVFTKSKLNIWLIYAVDYIFLLRFVDGLVDMSEHLQELFIGMIAYLAMENHFVPFKELQGYAHHTTPHHTTPRHATPHHTTPAHTPRVAFNCLFLITNTAHQAVRHVRGAGVG